MTYPAPTVAVRGSAERRVPPDSFVLHVAVEVRGPDAAAVNEQLAGRFSIVDAALAELAARPEAALTLQRGPLSVRRDAWTREGGGEPVVEWLAARGVTLTGREPARAGSLLGTVGELADQVAGLVVNGPHWELDDDNPEHAVVQAEAIRDARDRAARYAEAVGGHLGALVEIADSGMRAGRAMLMAASAGGGGLGAMDFTPEPVEVSASVEGRWHIDLG